MGELDDTGPENVTRMSDSPGTETSPSAGKTEVTRMGDGGGPVDALATGPEVDVPAPWLPVLVVQPATTNMAPMVANERSEAGVTFQRLGE